MLVKYEDLELDVIQSNEHEWLLSTELVAKGYGVSEVAIRSHKTRRPDELCEGKHFVTGGVANCNADNVKEGEQKIYWTKRGVIRLGFFIRSAAAAKFRDFAEDLIIDRMESAEVSEADAIIDTVRYVLSLSASNSVKADIIKRINQPEIAALPPETQIELYPASIGPKGEPVPVDEESGPRRSSATKLLRRCKAPIDVYEFNNALYALGYLEKRRIGWKSYNVLVGHGGLYGCNVPNPYYRDQTSPMYWVDTFQELLDIVLSS